MLEAKDDPWVAATLKVRNSKKKRLKQLSLVRQLHGESLHLQKDLVDEALDYVLAKYELEA